MSNSGLEASETIQALGEFGLIARLTADLPHTSAVIAGVGDDAAILDIGGNELLIATCDAQVEDTHFRLQNIHPHDLGRRVLAVNLSDIAAMGAKPRFALISLLLPPTFDVSVLDGIAGSSLAPMVVSRSTLTTWSTPVAAG